MCSLSAVYLGPNYGGGNGDNGNLLQKVPCMYCHSHCTPAPPPPTPQQATTDPPLHRRLLDTHGQVWGSLLSGHCSFLLGPGAQGSLYPPRVYFPVLCKFWQLSGGVNGDLLQEGLCHTPVCCTQSPCPCGSLLLTHSSTGDAQTHELHELYVESSLAITLIHCPCERA